MTTIRDQLRAYILSEFLPGESPENLRDDTPLKSTGVLDSLAVLNLVAYIEEAFGIDIEAHETGVDSFDRIESIADLIVRKQAARAVQPPQS
jgi:acyl carrier protein